MIVKATWPDILEVCLNLRKEDYDEVMLTRWTESEYDLASDFAHSPGGKFAVIYNDKPVCIFGVSPRTPGVNQGWLVGTDEIGKAGVEVAHACKKVIKTAFDNEVHRIHAYSSEFHHQAHEWLELIGFKRESTMKSFGKDGSDFYCYAVTK
jgi:RimJ/RimL family protein N-acetyltransferase